MASVTNVFAISGGGLGPVAFNSTGTLSDNIATTATANSNTEYTIGIDVSQTASVFLYTDGNLAVTTNAQNGSGGQNFTLTSGRPFFWASNTGINCPLSADVTSFWWHNATNTDVNVYGIVTQTPL